MLKKTITYTDYDGNVRTEDFYFNLSKADVLEMELGVAGGMRQMLERIIQEKDNRRIVEAVKDFIGRSYGVKSPDGKHFVKNKENLEAFMSTEAYTELLLELLQDGDGASAFINGIFPQELIQEAEQEQKKLTAVPSEQNN